MIIRSCFFKGKPIEFTKVDENSRRWLNEFRAKPFSVPGKLEDVECKNAIFFRFFLSILVCFAERPGSVSLCLLSVHPAVNGYLV